MSNLVLLFLQFALSLIWLLNYKILTLLSAPIPLSTPFVQGCTEEKSGA